MVLIGAEWDCRERIRVVAADPRVTWPVREQLSLLVGAFQAPFTYIVTLPLTAKKYHLRT